MAKGASCRKEPPGPRRGGRCGGAAPDDAFRQWARPPRVPCGLRPTELSRDGGVAGFAAVPGGPLATGKPAGAVRSLVSCSPLAGNLDALVPATTGSEAADAHCSGISRPARRVLDFPFAAVPGVPRGPRDQSVRWGRLCAGTCAKRGTGKANLRSTINKYDNNEIVLN